MEYMFQNYIKLAEFSLKNKDLSNLRTMKGITKYIKFLKILILMN